MPHRRRVAAALLGSAALVTLSAGSTSCSTDVDRDEVSASRISNQRPEAPSGELDPSDPDLSIPDLSIPDLTIPESLPDPDRIDECVELSTAYSEIIVLAFSGDDQGRLPGLFALLESAAPEDVLDDLAVIEGIVAEVAGGGLMDATGAMLDQEFTDANAVVVEWLADYCGSGDLGGAFAEPEGEGA